MNVAVITGAHGGIGQSLTAELISREWTVLAVCRTPEQAAAVDGMHRSDLVHSVHADVSNASDVDRVADVAAEISGAVDLLVNGAGVMPPPSTVATEASEDWTRTLQSNLTSAFLMSRALLPLVEKSSAGRIVNITGGLGTFAGGMTGGGQPSYRVSKAGLNALTLTLAEEVRGSGVNVVAFDPGWVRTSMGGPDAPRAAEDVAVEIADLVERMPGSKLTGVRIAGGEIGEW
jgi:NAD(P)-dependent dehydrogenase (short-subunit alcohol dehydrogenase family)